MPIFANINSLIFLILEKKNLCLLCSNSEKFKEKVKVTPILSLRNTKTHILMCLLLSSIILDRVAIIRIYPP